MFIRSPPSPLVRLTYPVKSSHQPSGRTNTHDTTGRSITVGRSLQRSPVSLFSPSRRRGRPNFFSFKALKEPLSLNQTRNIYRRVLLKLSSILLARTWHFKKWWMVDEWANSFVFSFPPPLFFYAFLKPGINLILKVCSNFKTCMKDVFRDAPTGRIFLVSTQIYLFLV